MKKQELTDSILELQSRVKFGKLIFKSGFTSLVQSSINVTLTPQEEISSYLLKTSRKISKTVLVVGSSPSRLKSLGSVLISLAFVVEGEDFEEDICSAVAIKGGSGKIVSGARGGRR